MTDEPGAGARVALVTGATRGLGAAIARRLGVQGLAVAVNSRSAAAAEEVAARLRAAGATAEAFPADVTDEQDVTRLVAEVAQRLGPVHALVLNATGAQPSVPVAELEWSAVLDQLSYFVRSPVLLARAVLPGMRAAGRGRIVCVGSDSTGRAVPGTSAYVAAKPAQLGLARVWARELGPYGITVNTVAPGWVPVERHAGVPERELQDYAATVPLGRTGVPDDVAGVVAFLVPDEAGFVNGAVVPVNGGTVLS